MIVRAPAEALNQDGAALRDVVSSRADLVEYLVGRGIDPREAGIDRVADPLVLPLRIPRYYLDLIDWHDPADPLRRQVLPLADEASVAPIELHDPIGDEAHSPVPGIVHRYSDRVLLFLTSACAVHCRFCFRREYVGTPALTLGRAQLEEAYQYIAAHREIWEVILSGGDALSLPDAAVAPVFERLRAIEHVRIIRIHSRVPAVQPSRLTGAFGELLRRIGPTYLIVHVNHPREVTSDFAEGVGQLVDRGVPVLSQSVLMRGVNDDVTTLAALFRRLVEARVKPYYLHQLDLAPGTGHFRVPIRRSRELYRELRRSVSGLCLPTYMLEIPGGHGKVPITADYVHPTEDGFIVENDAGERFDYREP